jgi:hypothetical protein
MLVFDVLPAKNPVWTAVITGYSQIEQGGVALELLEKMGIDSVSACSGLGFLQGGGQIHAYPNQMLQGQHAD